jgi:hypothetical protein
MGMIMMPSEGSKTKPISRWTPVYQKAKHREEEEKEKKENVMLVWIVFATLRQGDKVPPSNDHHSQCKKALYSTTPSPFF